MNQLSGMISQIQSSAAMSLVEVSVYEDRFCAIVLEIPAQNSYLKVGEPIEIVFKETEVVLAKNLSGIISLRNRAQACVKSIERSSLLTKVIMDYHGVNISSIVTSRSVDELALKEGDIVQWLVKTNEVSLKI